MWPVKRQSRAITASEEEQGQPCGVLIFSDGLARAGHFLELPDQVIRQMTAVDTFGLLPALRAVVPGMVQRGRRSVVAASSAAGRLGTFAAALTAVPTAHAPGAR